MNLVRGRTSHRGKLTGHSSARIGAAVAASALILAATAACGSSAGSDDTSSGANGEIGLSLNGNVEYTKNLTTGVLAALDGGSYSLKTVQANFDVNAELTNVESLIDQGAKGLVINPNTTQGVLAGVKRAHEAGLPVGLAFWTGPTVLDKYLATVSYVDSEAIGRELGEYLKAHGKPGPTVVVQGVLGQGFSEGIDKGLDAALAGSGFEIVVREQGYFDRNKAITVTESALQAHPDTTAIVDYSSAMGNGISSYLKSNEYDDITHVTVSVDKEMLQWLGTPYLAATSYYSPAEAGSLAAGGVRKALEGTKPTFKQEIFHGIGTEENIDQLLKEHPYTIDAYVSKVKIS